MATWTSTLYSSQEEEEVLGRGWGAQPQQHRLVALVRLQEAAGCPARSRKRYVRRCQGVRLYVRRAVRRGEAVV